MIPVRNWFLLLAFHWRDAGLLDDALIDGCTFDHPWDVAARLLDESLRRLWRRGLEVRFASFDEVGPRPRGALDLPTTLRERLEERGRLAYRYDDLSSDTPANRVVKAAVLVLIRAPGVDPAVRTRLRRHLDLLATVTSVAPAAALRETAEPPRRERTYGEALHVARLVLQHQVADELARDPHRSDMARLRARVPDGQVAARVFEGFVRGAARFFCGPQASVTSPRLRFTAAATSPRASALLPEMQLDACVQWPTRHALIIDCKYYEQPLVTHHHGGAERFRTNHLYQLTAYMRALGRDMDSVAGAVVYARVADDLDEAFILDGSHVRMVALDLAAPWRALRDQVHNVVLWTAEPQPARQLPGTRVMGA